MEDAQAGINELSEETKDDLIQSYLRIRFRGGRFEGSGGMPLASLEELGYLDKLINDLARFLWRKHKNRQRLDPDEYPAAPILKVQRFAKGSSIPLIESETPGASGALFVHPYDPHAASRDLVEKTFWSIVENAEIPDEFPGDFVPQLKRIGKTLLDGETQEFLEIRDDGEWVERPYTRKARIDFWKDFESRQIEQRVVIGQVVTLQRAGNGSFEFKELSGQLLSGKSGTHWDSLWSALGKMESHRYSRLYADVEVDYVGRIRKITQLHNVEVLDVDAEHWPERFRALSTLQDSEAHGTSLVLTSILERTDALLKQVRAEDIQFPAIFPSLEGGTNLIWDLPVGRITLYVEEDEDFEVELVPHGPIIPFSTSSALEAIQKVQEFIDA